MSKYSVEEIQSTIDGMIVEHVAIDDLTEYVNNTKIHTDEQIDNIVENILESRFNNPIGIDGDNTILAGHGRVLAAKKLGLKRVPVIRLDHLSDEEKRKYIIADNKLSMSTGFDEDKLRLEMSALAAMDVDLSNMGFGEDELELLTLPVDADLDGLNDLLDGLDGDIEGDTDIDVQTPNSAPKEIKDVDYEDSYKVIVDCKDEQDQERVYEMMEEQGYTCKVISMTK